MEQKRTLWIVASVGIFLLVVLGGMLIFYKPQARTQTVAEASPPVRSTSDGWVNPPVDSASSDRNGTSQQSDVAQQSENVGKQGNEINNFASAAQAAQTPQTAQQVAQTQNATQDAAQAISTQAQNETQVAQGIPAQSAAQPSVTSVNDMTVYSQNTTVYGPIATNAQLAETAGGTVIDLNAPRGTSESNAALAATSGAASQAMAVPAQSATVTRISAAASPSAASAGSASAARTASAAATSAARTPAAATRQTQYWVQAASFTNKSGADTARGTLDSNKIPSDIFTYRDGNGNVFYRVRVGPYTTKSEAEYWRTRVAQISDFQTTESYVTQTTTVN